jgi:hypothetical protein
VPGISYLYEGTDESKAKGCRNILIAVVYIILGIAILVICFDLMQDKMKKEAKKLKKIKQLLAKKKDQEDELKRNSNLIQNQQPLNYGSKMKMTGSNKNFHDPNMIFVRSKEVSKSSIYNNRNNLITSGLNLNNKIDYGNSN